MIEFIPTTCECGEKLKVTTGKNGKYKLMCVNTDCIGVAVLKFQKGMSCFEIAGIGPSTYKKLYDAGIRDIADLLCVEPSKLIDSGEFKSGRSLEKLIQSIESVKNIKFSDIIESLQFDGVGKTISKECEKFFFDLDYDPAGIEHKLREKIQDKNSEIYVKTLEVINVIVTLTNVNVIMPDKNKKETVDTNIEIKIMEMTGSPKSFGFNTKNDFIKAVEPFGLVQGKLNKDCDYLVTDDTSSKTSKMEKVDKINEKFGTNIEIITYIELFNMFNK
jgi:NAD-dependent DNA ligase